MGSFRRCNQLKGTVVFTFGAQMVLDRLRITNSEYGAAYGISTVPPRAGGVGDPIHGTQQEGALVSACRGRLSSVSATFRALLLHS